MMMIMMNYDGDDDNEVDDNDDDYNDDDYSDNTDNDYDDDDNGLACYIEYPDKDKLSLTQNKKFYKNMPS